MCTGVLMGVTSLEGIAGRMSVAVAGALTIGCLGVARLGV